MDGAFIGKNGQSANFDVIFRKKKKLRVPYPLEKYGLYIIWEGGTSAYMAYKGFGIYL
jgi:hypothetical protein